MTSGTGFVPNGTGPTEALAGTIAVEEIVLD
jgi:hypothetical protein